MKMKIFSCNQWKWVALFTSKIGSKHSQPRGQCLAFPSLQPDVFWAWLLGSSCSCSPKKARSMAEARLSRLRGCCLNKPLQAGPCQWHASRAVEWKYTHSGGFQQTGQPNAASPRGSALLLSEYGKMPLKSEHSVAVLVVVMRWKKTILRKSRICPAATFSVWLKVTGFSINQRAPSCLGFVSSLKSTYMLHTCCVVFFQLELQMLSSMSPQGSLCKHVFSSRRRSLLFTGENMITRKKYDRGALIIGKVSPLHHTQCIAKLQYLQPAM